MASRSRRNQPGQRNDYPWYTFLWVVGPEVLWNAKLEWMKQRKIHVLAVFNWQWSEQTGLLEGIEPYFVRNFAGVHGQFKSMGWRQLFQIQEIVYKELVIEFLGTISFRRKDGAFDEDNLTFFLGGE
ncbi:unnamed protein product [Lactuca virosa]|uniref:Uncharacterized protein n=1 Tax=Lactuca virosa TaxID=75947 RepID=A0AAU9PK29_9ASTR|nr:unnamed protein product [Lactuca virosa]